MNDIYEYKAKKYKYKYLKLKNELEGGGLFDNKEKTKEKTVEILQKVIENVNSVITPLFNTNKVLAELYSENEYILNKNKAGYIYNNKEVIDKMLKKNNNGLDHYYPCIIKYYYYYLQDKDQGYNYDAKIAKLSYYNDVPKRKYTDNAHTIFNSIIVSRIKNLDIYIIIMFIKNLFHYKIYSKFDKNTTIKLVNKLVDDGYKNEINSPNLLIVKIQEIIDSINVSIPTATAPTQK